MVLIPAYNEEATLASVLREVTQYVPAPDVLVVSDGSADRTAAVARQAGAAVLDLPVNLGVGGAVQAGLIYAGINGYRQVIRMDADGQHPAGAIPDLLAAAANFPADMILASRFLAQSNGYTSTALRCVAIRGLAQFMSLACHKRVTDPTSGFMLLKGPLIHFFSRAYPSEYPEAEALAMLRRHGYDFAEIPVAFRERARGVSSIRGWGTITFALQVILALVVDRMESVKPGLSRHEVVSAHE
jgi:glycosyltransferase involved in cell wall biosynthesis